MSIMYFILWLLLKYFHFLMNTKLWILVLVEVFREYRWLYFFPM